MTTQKRMSLVLLYELYSATNGDTSLRCDLQSLCSKIGLPEDLLAQKFDYLKTGGLISPFGSGYNCHITHKGVDLIESNY